MKSNYYEMMQDILKKVWEDPDNYQIESDQGTFTVAEICEAYLQFSDKMVTKPGRRPMKAITVNQMKVNITTKEAREDLDYLEDKFWIGGADLYDAPFHKDLLSDLIFGDRTMLEVIVKCIKAYWKRGVLYDGTIKKPDELRPDDKRIQEIMERYGIMKQGSKMKVLYFESGEAPKEIEIDEDIESIRNLIGAYDLNETSLSDDRFILVRRSGGEFKNLPPSASIAMGRFIYGPCFVCRNVWNDFASIEPGDKDDILKLVVPATGE